MTPEKKANIEAFSHEFRGIGVVEDSGWFFNDATSMPHRGISDYNRIIEFTRPITAGEMKEIKEWLSTNNCPGWTGIHGWQVKDGKYKFTTTWDSSD